MIELSIDNIYGTDFTTKWKDSKKSKLEDQLVFIVQGMDRTFRHKKQQSIEAAKARKLREIENAKRQEIKRLADIENRQRELLFSLVEQQKSATALRNLISLFEESELPEEFSPWLDWAKAVADSINPIKNAETILNEHNKIAE
jgi:hypothetical protein